MFNDFTSVILAGGKSSRMGTNKALLPFGGFKTLTEYQIAKFSPYFTNLHISCKDKVNFDFDANFIEDLPRYKDSAPHVALISIFETLNVDTIFVLSVDTPFFNIDHFKKLYRVFDGKSTIAKSPYGNEPLCAIYTREILPKLKELADKKKYRFADLFDRIDHKFVKFENRKIFTNLNTLQEYKGANRL